MAGFVRNAQLSQLKESIQSLFRAFPEPAEVVVVSGSGEFLATAAAEIGLPQCPILKLSEQLGVETSRCAPAFALAELATLGQ